MRVIKFSAAAVLLAVMLASAAQAVSVGQLGSFQAEEGGFVLRDGAPVSVEATAHALFLNSLYGLSSMTNIEGSLAFLKSSQNRDGGYGAAVGMPSDLHSTHDAVVGMQLAGAPLASYAKAVGGFVETMWLPSAELYAMASGSGGSMAASAYAVQTLALMDAPATQHAAALKKKCAAAVASSGDHFAFSDDGELDVSAQTYFGLVLAKHVGFKLDTSTLAGFEAWILAQAEATRMASWEDLANIMYLTQALDLVHELQGVDAAVVPLMDEDSVLARKLVQFASSAAQYADNLRAVASAHRIVALMQRVDGKALLAHRINYQVLDAAPVRGDSQQAFLQGSAIRPILSVGNMDGVLNERVAIEGSCTLPSGTRRAFAMTFSPEQGAYIADEYVDTSEELGFISFEYKLSVRVSTVGLVWRNVVDERRLGYNIEVAARAMMAGKHVSNADPVGLGTEFEFDVTLGSLNTASFVSGAFKLTLNVLDSSLVSIAEQTIDGHSNSAPLAFKYTHATANIPSGHLIFRFEVTDDAGSTHTRGSKIYSLGAPMMAAELSLASGGEFQLGSKIAFTMKATVLDAATGALLPFDGAHAAERQFQAALMSMSGEALEVVQGSASSDGTYSFSFTVPSTMDVIGDNVVVIYYVTASNERVDVQNEPVTLRVVADLSLTALTAEPKAGGDYFYGDALSFAFKIRDARSKSIVRLGAADRSAVVLTLTHGADKQDLGVAQLQEDGESFALTWTINANSVAGAGVLSLEGRNGGGEPVAIKNAAGSGDVAYAVNIGGDIVVESNVHASKPDEYMKRVVLSTDFQLTCRGSVLPDAELLAAVFVGSGSSRKLHLGRVPVAVEASRGRYQVTWIEDAEDLSSGDYTVAFVGAGMDPAVAKPMFEIVVPYNGSAFFGTQYLRLEYAVLAFVMGAFFVTRSKRGAWGV